MSRVSELLETIKELLDFVDDKMKPVITKSLNKQGISNFDLVNIFLFAKSTKTFRALFILCHQHYGEDAAILARSILENLINLAYIEKEASEDRAELFVGYSILDNKKKVESIKNDPSFEKLDIEKKFNNNLGKNLELSIKIHKTECKRIKKAGRYDIKKHSWSCLSIKDMAIETGLKSPYYDKVYWLISQFTHPHAGGSKGYLYKDKDGLTINDLPSEIWAEESLVVGFDCYSRILYLFNEIFRLGLEDEIKKIEKKYLKILGK